MGFLVAIIVGGLAGWIASMVMNRDASMGILMNVVVGVVGAFIGNLLAGPLFGVQSTIQTFNLAGFIIAIIGAIALLAVVNMVQRKKIR